MTESLDYYADLVDESKKEHEDRNKTLAKIDEIDLCKYTAPPELSALRWWKTIKILAPRDALKSASRALATIMPKIEIQPQSPNEGEMDRVEIVERVLEWQFAQMNRRGVGNPLWDIVNSALKYGMVAYQPVYMPYYMEGKSDKRSKFLGRNGDFVWKVHNPQNVYPRFDNYGLLNVALVQDMTLDQLAAEYGKDNPGYKKLLATYKKDKDKDIGNEKIIYSDFTDWDDRICWAERDGDKFELMRKPHYLPFLNWVVRQGGEPLLKGIVDSDMYDTATTLASLRYALVLGVVSHPATKSKTFSGESPEVDNTDPAGNVPLKPGEEIEPMHPRILDPHLSEILNEAVAAIHGSTVSRALGTLEFSGNMPFSTVNAILTAAISSLSIARKTAETAIEDGFYLNLQWVKHYKKPLTGYRNKTSRTGNPLFERGAYVTINPSDIQESNINITVSLIADTATDKAERTNRAINWHQNLNVPLKTCYEEIQIDNFDVQQSEFVQEQLFNEAIKNRLYKMDLQAQDELKQQVMQEFAQQMQAEEQARQQQMQGMEQPPMEGQPMMQGQNPAEGGMVPAQAEPGMTRETVSGQDWSGQAVQRV